jgi:hypothetical protein
MNQENLPFPGQRSPTLNRMQSENFFVTREDIQEKLRVPGVSALIRYYNDRHTLIPCLESIRGVFDEIVIVYQPCDDFSEEILTQIEEGGIPSLSGENIRVFAYPWFVYPPLYPVIHGGVPIRNSLANYCNYGLSKINRENFIKIDTDQIYLTERFKEMVRTGVSEGIDFSPFGINVFFSPDGNPHVNPSEI